MTSNIRLPKNFVRDSIKAEYWINAQVKFVCLYNNLAYIVTSFQADSQNLQMKLKSLFSSLILITLVLANFLFARPALKERDRRIVVYHTEAGAAPQIEAKQLSDEEAQAMLLDPQVERIDNDPPVQAAGQTLPWGVDRIDAEKAQSAAQGEGVKVAIIDSGIDLDHPDLAGRVAGGYNVLSPGASYDDDFGHGTHVAGIVAASNNSQGSVGVAPLADLYAVKVLDSTGAGFVSNIIKGINWAADNGMQIINLSLTAPTDVPSLREAVSAAVSRGIVVVVAAGNDGGAVKYPAAYPEVIAVAATDQADALASWSARGPEIDLAAPGASIYSTYAGGIYKLMRGTSMAAPHVTGAASLILSQASLGPAEVRQKLIDSAEVLPSGYKLVDAEQAVAAAPGAAFPAVPAAAHAPGALINAGGTIWRISDDGQTRAGFDSAEKFLSHRFRFSNVVPASSADMQKPEAGLMPWGDGVLFNDGGTVYQISGGRKHGFTSAMVFLAQGFRFENVIPGSPNAPLGPDIVDFDKHLPGTFVLDNGTVYLVTAAGLSGVPSPPVLFSLGASFTDVVIIGSADRV